VVMRPTTNALFAEPPGQLRWMNRAISSSLKAEGFDVGPGLSSNLSRNQAKPVTGQLPDTMRCRSRHNLDPGLLSGAAAQGEPTSCIIDARFVSGSGPRATPPEGERKTAAESGVWSASSSHRRATTTSRIFLG